MMFNFLRWGASCLAIALRTQQAPPQGQPARPPVSLAPLAPHQSVEEPSGEAPPSAAPAAGAEAGIQPEDLDSFWHPQAIERMLADAKLRESRQRIAQAAADAGTGPQRYDRDWIGNEEDGGRDVSQMTDGWGWHKLQDLIEVLEWAVASPQGQRAQALASDPNNPGAATLELIQQMQLELRKQCHTLLQDHAEELDYPDHWIADLSNALHEARCLN